MLDLTDSACDSVDSHWVTKKIATVNEQWTHKYAFKSIVKIHVLFFKDKIAFSLGCCCASNQNHICSESVKIVCVQLIVYVISLELSRQGLKHHMFDEENNKLS